MGGGRSAEEVAAAYERAGWSVRRCGRTEYEARSPWAELVVEPASAGGVLVHGPVADVAERADLAVAPLRDAGLPFAAECYAADGALLREMGDCGAAA